MLSGMKLLVQALPLLLVVGVVLHASCADSSATGDTTSNVTVNNPPVEACNDGQPDGFCNALGAVPETCDCFDCVETAYCLGTCDDDDACGAGEDCTCIDCFEANDCDGEDPTTDNTTVGPGGSPPEGGGGAGMGGAPATSTATSTSTVTTTTSGNGGAGGAGGI